MMNQIVSNQTLLFITCIEIGLIMGVFFDLVRIFSKIIKHPNFFVQIEDTLYWVGCALISFYLLYIRNYAAIRPFVFVGMILGGILYFATFSIVFMKMATAVIDYIKKIIAEVIKLLLIPIRIIIKGIKRPLGYMQYKVGVLHNYERREIRKLNRRWYHKKADLLTDYKVRSQLKKQQQEQKLLSKEKK